MRDKYLPAKPADVKKVIELKWGSQTEDGTPCATLDEAKAAAEASLGVQTVLQVPLRWKVDGDCAVALRLGEVVIAEAYTPVDGDKAWWHVDTRYSIQPRNDDFTSRAAAMRAAAAR